MTAATLLPVALTVIAFALGVGVGWLWWGRQFVRARLTRDEALSIMRARIEQEPRDATGPLVPREPGRVT